MKLAAPGARASFEAEAAGLAELRATGALRIPRTLAVGGTADAAFLAARPIQQRIEANGGWPNGAAAFVGENPAAGAVIT